MFYAVYQFCLCDEPFFLKKIDVLFEVQYSGGRGGDFIGQIKTIQNYINSPYNCHTTFN
jgi:hypothetical protein